MAGLSHLAPAEGLLAALARMLASLAPQGRISKSGHAHRQTDTRTFLLFNKDMSGRFLEDVWDPNLFWNPKFL